MNTQKKRIAFFAILICALVIMQISGTLAYPAIMAGRQLQSIRDCTFGLPHFMTNTYGFSFTVPDGYCVLPNRLFPVDGSIEIVPKDFYFVFNEYAKGTIASASRASILLEPMTSSRYPQRILQTLLAGKFLVAQNIQSTTTPSGIAITLADNVLGTDAQRYDWALVPNHSNTYFMILIAKHGTTAVRDFILQNLTMLPGGR